MFCEYSNALGIPGEGFHKHFMGIAYMDLLGTFVVANIISYIAEWNFYLVFFAIFLTGIFVHRLFCVRTTVDKYLFP